MPLPSAPFVSCDAQRGLHDEFVFVASKGKPRKPIRYMNNTAWQNARKKAGLVQVRVHDSTLLRVATGQLQVVNGEKSRKSRARIVLPLAALSRA